ncbi:MAG: cytotoxic translational repressor of toxin-antitoxin stability system [Geobacter sp.]|nr:MAG: cytotoxic translational repressor of toxin-antitoxin stability system [Geobacter sp.]
MKWTVTLHRVVQKQLPKLPEKILDILERLLADIEISGPVRGNWPNYSKLTDGRHHCHLKKGKPTYVAVWSEDRETVKVEVIYVGTHEKAPY